MPFLLALLPLILVIGGNAVFTYLVFPNVDFTEIQTKFPNLRIKGSVGLW